MKHNPSSQGSLTACFMAPQTEGGLTGDPSHLISWGSSYKQNGD